MSAPDTGRINNALKALTDGHAIFSGRPPSRIERSTYRTLVEITLRADDKWLVNRTRVRDDMVRVHLGKAQATITALREKIRRRNMADRERAARMKPREAKIEEREAAVAEREQQVEGWQRASAGYIQQADILRRQLEDAGIETDPRCR